MENSMTITGSPVRMYQKLQKPGQKWHIHGYFALFGNVCLMSFYTVVSGWILYYFIMFLTGQSAGLSFGGMISNPTVNMTFMLVAVVLGFAVLSFNLQGGLERVTKYMMVALLGLMVVLAVNSATLSGAKEGLTFYLLPDFGKITPSVIVGAMNQAFFTLSLGIGSMAIFGSYIGKERSLMGESVNIINSADNLLGTLNREVGLQTFDGNNRLSFTHLSASSQLWQRTIWVPSSMVSSGMHSLHLSQAKSHLGSNWQPLGRL